MKLHKNIYIHQISLFSKEYLKSILFYYKMILFGNTKQKYGDFHQKKEEFLMSIRIGINGLEGLVSLHFKQL